MSIELFPASDRGGAASGARRLNRGLILELETAAGVALALRSRRAELGWLNRRIHAAEALAAALARWRATRAEGGEVLGDFGRGL